MKTYKDKTWPKCCLNAAAQMHGANLKCHLGYGVGPASNQPKIRKTEILKVVCTKFDVESEQKYFWKNPSVHFEPLRKGTFWHKNGLSPNVYVGADVPRSWGPIFFKFLRIAIIIHGPNTLMFGSFDSLLYADSKNIYFWVPPINSIGGRAKKVKRGQSTHSPPLKRRFRIG